VELVWGTNVHILNGIRDRSPNQIPHVQKNIYRRTEDGGGIPGPKGRHGQTQFLKKTWGWKPSTSTDLKTGEVRQRSTPIKREARRGARIWVRSLRKMSLSLEIVKESPGHPKVSVVKTKADLNQVW